MLTKSKSKTSAAVLWLFVLGWWSSSTTLSVVVAAASSSYDFSSYRPPTTCIAAGQRCYDTSQEEQENKYSDCCEGHKCVGGPWSATCQKCSGGGNKCKNSDLPQSDPKGIAGLDYNVQTVQEANDNYNDDPNNTCPYMTNMGSTLGASTGYDSEPFPLLGQNNIYNPAGRESQVAVLIGGDYIAPQAAELEGKIVVLGDFLIGSSGTNSLGWAGAGSGIFPEEGVFLQVGGNIDGGKTDGETWSMLGGSIEYGGQCLSTPANARTDGSYPDALACGSLFVATGASLTQTPLDTARWDALFQDLQAKSEYWYGLTPNGRVTPTKAGPGGNTMILHAGEDDACLQVFLLDRFDLIDPWTIQLDQSLIGKTILINVSPFDSQGNMGEVQIQNIGNFIDPWGGSDSTFSSLTKQSMLWNFYGATKVTLGPGGGVQFPGSVLIPHGDFDMLWPGQDGRTIVYGDCLHNAPGSEFHNYEFDPPCPLPLPPNLPVPVECETPEAFTEYCIEDTGVLVLQDEIIHPLPPGALTTSNLQGTSVDFTITQTWKSDDIISWITPVYKQDENDEYICDTNQDKRESVKYNEAHTYTAQCDPTTNIAHVILYVHDGSHETSETNIHDCSGWGNDEGIATYIFDIPCHPNQDLCDEPELPELPVVGAECELPGFNDETICPDKDIISTLAVKVDNGNVVPEGLVPSTIFYNLEFTGTSTTPELSFQIDNPFEFEVDILVQFHSRPPQGGGYALDPACEASLNAPDCNPDVADIFTAACPPSRDPTKAASTIVSIFFISDNPLLGAGGGSDVQPFECCPIPDEDANKPIIEYTFQILCECPPDDSVTPTRSLLRKTSRESS